MTADDAPAAIQIDLTSDTKYLASIRGLILSLTQTCGFDVVESGHIALAVDETLANIIRHGYQLRNDQPIKISIWLLEGVQPGIKIVIEDEAMQIDPDEICGRDLDDIKPGGLGVHIIRDVMDECTFSKRACKGMRVTLLKHLKPKTLDCTENTNTPR